MGSEQQLHVLFHKFINKTCNSNELEELFRYFDATDEVVLRALIAVELQRSENEVDRLSALQLAHLMQVNDRLHQQMKRSYYPKRSLAIAAAVCLFSLLAIGIYRFVNDQQQKKEPHSKNLIGNRPDLAPAQRRAELIASDGTVHDIQLKDSLIVGKDGTISLTNAETNTTKVFNEQVEKYHLKTTVASTYSILLSDGTTVWMNAGSEIVFPKKFQGTKRDVHLLYGEAYFEVAKNPNKPFVVYTPTIEVTALGTQFNINLHSKASKTILTEGEISVAVQGERHILHPGQMALLQNGSIALRQAEVEEATAWKDGYFYFRGETMMDILTEFSRWYGVDLKIDDVRLTRKTYSGTIKRTLTLVNAAKLLQIIFEGYNIDFDGKILIVSGVNKEGGGMK